MTVAGPMTGVISATHPELRTRAGAVGNDGYRPPLTTVAEHAPRPPRALGAPTSEMSFTRPAMIRPGRDR